METLADSLHVQLERAGIPVERIILFGSYARGNHTDASDIDLAVVSEAFSGVRFHDVSRIIDAVTLPDSRVEIHPYRPCDFTNGDPFAQEILKTGTVLFDKEPAVHNDGG
jgi:predicted nucleotidyltransferase